MHWQLPIEPEACTHVESYCLVWIPPDIRGQHMASHVEAELIKIKKDNLKERSLRAQPGEEPTYKLSFVHVQSKAYYFRDVARLDMWCRCMIGGRDNAQPEGRWCVHREANQDGSFLEKSERSLISKDST